jgi:putative endonuclease
MDNRRYGQVGEEIAIAFLRKAGYDIIETNYKTKFGEIDIIGRDEATNVFVEVKRRKTLKMGRPSEAVNYYKKMHIIRTAYMYVKRFKINEQPMRFDIIEIVGNDVTHYKDAFQVPSVGWFM